MAIDERTKSLRFENLLGAKFAEGNEILSLRNGDEIFGAMLKAIRNAERAIDFLTFVFWPGETANEFAAAFAEKAREGVRVRVLLDAYGSGSLDPACLAVMEDAGVQVAWFRTMFRFRFWRNNNRTHRKVLVCDGRIAFTGGVGIADEWRGNAEDRFHWRDTHFQVRGPAVQGLYAAFLSNWVEATNEIPPAEELDLQKLEANISAIVIQSSSTAGWSDAKMILRVLMGIATRSIRITTPYFVPDLALRVLIVEALRRGVSVEMVMPGRFNNHPIVKWAATPDIIELVKAGAAIYLYDKTMIHTKTVTVDGHLSFVGSVNCNHRSMCLDDEVGLLVDSQSFASELESHFARDKKESTRADVRDLRPKTAGDFVRNAIARLFRTEI